jgi:DNA polymerase III epsilon subunit-like protein
LETTGTQPGYHEIIQIAIVPLNRDIRPLQELPVFYQNIKPKFPKRASKAATAKHGITIEDLVLEAPESEKVEDMLVEWFERLELPFGKVLVPLAHNWAFECSFLKAWLGVDMVDKVFHSHARDGMLTAIHLNDRAAFAGEPEPFNRVGLGSVCRKFGIVNTHAHDALADAYAGAEAYRAMCLGMV